MKFQPIHDHPHTAEPVYSPIQSREWDYQESFLRTISIQELLWTQMPIGTALDMTIIRPMLAKVRNYKGGGYVKFLVQVKSSNNEDILIAGDFVILQLPLKTWERAMYSIPTGKKALWRNLQEDNIYFKGKKASSSLLNVENMERNAITPEQFEKAKEVYGGKKW